MSLTKKICWGMLGGIVVGLLLKLVPFKIEVVSSIVTLGGDIFLALMKMLIGPLVFVSLVCSIGVVDDVKKLGKLGWRAFGLFVVTTVVGVILALGIANLFNLGANVHWQYSSYHVAAPSITQLLSELVPSNLLQALVNANVLQIIVVALLFGIVLNRAGESGKRLMAVFQDLNTVLMQLVIFLMQAAPYGVFCLMALLFLKLGFAVIFSVLGYFLTVLLVLSIHSVVVYGYLLKRAHLSPVLFFKKLYSVIMFSFSVSSSTASIPIAMEALENKLGIASAVTAFIMPLGININKNGTAIMQAIATVFIAHAYQIEIGWVGYGIIVLMSVLISLGTAGAPGIGMITLIMLLKQLGLPLEGIALIIGVDRLLDMARTTVNVLGNALVTCLVAKAEQQIDYNLYYKTM